MKNFFMRRVLFFLLRIVPVFIFTFIGNILYGQPPTFEWVRQLGGFDNVRPHDMALDGNGNIYLTGGFTGTGDFNPSPFNSFDLFSAGDYDAFLCKLRSNGDFAWAVQLGDSTGDWSGSIAIDDSGNVILAGYFTGVVDFDPGPSVYALATPNSSNPFSSQYRASFICKLDSSGNFIWAKQLSGLNGNCMAFDVSTDDSNNVYTTGWFGGNVDFDPDTSVYSIFSTSSSVFVSKLTSTGNVVWAKAMIGDNYLRGLSICCDKMSNIFVTGGFKGTTDFDPDTGITNLYSAGDEDIFVLKLDRSGILQWVKKIGSSQNDFGNHIGIDSSGSILVSGYFDETVDFDPGPAVVNLIEAGNGDGFILKLDSLGNFSWARSLGGTSYDYTRQNFTDNEKNVYCIGNFAGTANFDPGFSNYTLYSNGPSDAYISKYDSAGNFLWVVEMSGSGNEYGWCFQLDQFGSIFSSGTFFEPIDCDPGSGSYILNNVGIVDAYVLKLSQTILSVPDEIKNTEISIYPNPTSETIAVKILSSQISSSALLKVYNFIGEEIYRDYLSNYISSKQLIVDATYFPAGIYYVVIDDGKKVYQKSFCKMK